MVVLVVVRGMGRCGGGGGVGERKGGAGMWGRQAAEYVCTANLTRTFEKAKSQRERCCLGSAALQTASAEAGRALSYWSEKNK